LLGNDTVNTFPQQQIHKDNRITVGSGIFCAVRVVSNILCIVKGKQAINSSQNVSPFPFFCIYKYPTNPKTRTPFYILESPQRTFTKLKKVGQIFA
jgi:hypothetical protein